MNHEWDIFSCESQLLEVAYMIIKSSIYCLALLFPAMCSDQSYPNSISPGTEICKEQQWRGNQTIMISHNRFFKACFNSTGDFYITENNSSDNRGDRSRNFPNYPNHYNFGLGVKFNNQGVSCLVVDNYGNFYLRAKGTGIPASAVFRINKDKASDESSSLVLTDRGDLELVSKLKSRTIELSELENIPID